MRGFIEVMARGSCEPSKRTRFAKRPRGSQAPTRECTVPLEIAPSVVSMAPHMKHPFRFRDMLRAHASSRILDSVLRNARSRVLFRQPTTAAALALLRAAREP